FGFWPWYLIAIMGRKVGDRSGVKYARYSEGSDDERTRWRSHAREITDAIYPGLDVSIEIESVYTQKLGDTILVFEGDDVAAFSVCHAGPGTEAGPGKCYMKFAAARPGPEVRACLSALLDAVHDFAAASALKFIEGGVNMARREAFQAMLDKGFRVLHQGVAMQRGNEAGYNRDGVYVIDDWR
ncbi:MAG: GNAT family N-acetyltransferase, partial [Candidatus Hydrogenedentota bacterium]